MTQTKRQIYSTIEMARISETVTCILELSKSTGKSIESLCETISSMALRRMKYQEIEEAEELDYENSLYVNAEEEAEATGGISNQS